MQMTGPYLRNVRVAAETDRGSSASALLAGHSPANSLPFANYLHFCLIISQDSFEMEIKNKQTRW